MKRKDRGLIAWAQSREEKVRDRSAGHTIIKHPQQMR